MINFIYYEGEKFRGRENFAPLLKILEDYPFPSPKQLMWNDAKLNWVESTIALVSFRDTKLLKLLNPKKKLNSIVIDHLRNNHLQVSIYQDKCSCFGLSNLVAFLDAVQLKQLFFDILYTVPLWDRASCGEEISDIYYKYFVGAANYNPLYWLQYFGKIELEKRGGFAAFESNPYVTTQRVHDGIVVQVGESHDYLLTPEGEQLLVNAIRALPPVMG